MDCRLEHSRQWAVRIMHEAQLHEHNWFITLTYRDAPRELIKWHLQDFWKRLRHYQKEQLRYFACGEYGDKTGRPHYHAALFNYNFTDLVKYSESKNSILWTSKHLDEVWGHGECKIGRLTQESAMYVASYVTKKVVRDKGKAEWALDEKTGELYERELPFARMSLRPAIGRSWISKYTNDVYNYDHVIVNGQPNKPPRYYDKFLERHDPARLEKWKQQRKEEAWKQDSENTRERLEARAKITAARLKLKKRTL